MPVPLIPLALSLAQFAPKLIGWLAGDNAGDKAEHVAETVVNIATTLTGQQNPQQAVQAIQNNPELQLKFQEQANEYALGLAREETARMAMVFKDQEGGREIIKTAIMSNDDEVRKARPRMMVRLGNCSIVYAFYAPLAVIAAGGMNFSAATMGDFMSIIKWIGGFLFSAFMTSFTGYTVARTTDKKILAGNAPGKTLQLAAKLGKLIS